MISLHYTVLLYLVLGVVCVGCGKDPPTVEQSIRTELKKPTGELTHSDYEKVT